MPLSFVDRSATDGKIGPIPMSDDDSERPHSRESFSARCSCIARGPSNGVPVRQSKARACKGAENRANRERGSMAAQRWPRIRPSLLRPAQIDLTTDLWSKLARLLKQKSPLRACENRPQSFSACYPLSSLISTRQKFRGGKIQVKITHLWRLFLARTLAKNIRFAVSSAPFGTPDHQEHT